VFPVAYAVYCVIAAFSCGTIVVYLVIFAFPLRLSQAHVQRHRVTV
jgi:hypothetical protein